MSFFDTAREIEDLVRSKGIQTFAIILRDPDTMDCFSCWDGDQAVIEWRTRIMAERIIRQTLKKWEQEDEKNG